MTPPEELTTVLPSRGERVGRRLHPATVLLAALSAWLAVEAVLSVWWGMELDTPDLSYLAFMIDRLGRIPYAQTFDPSAPGSLLFHLGIGKTVGYSEIAFGIVNLAWLSALLFLTRRLMRPFGPRIAWAASVLVGLGYLQHGRDMSLQRDYIALVPIVAACVVAERSGRGRSIRRAAAIGLLFGLAATIKPQLALGLPVVVLFFVTGGGTAFRDSAAWKDRLRVVAVHSGAAASGFMVPVAAALAWVAYLGGWQAFVDYYTKYLPLYLHLDAEHHALAGSERFTYLVKGVFNLGGLWAWVLPALLAVYGTLVGRKLTGERRRLVWLLVAMASVYAVEPALAGQFFDYHWMPFQQFLLCLAAVVLIEPFVLASGEKVPRWFGTAVLTIAVVLALRPAPELVDQLRDHHVPAAEQGRADQIAAYLRANLRPGDTVQPLDWVNGAEHGMLLAQASIATRFVHEYQFFHDVASPEIQSLRREFIAELNRVQPRFIIDVHTGRPYVSGPGTSDTFPELDALLAQHYHPVHDGTGFTIDERTSKW